MNKIRVIARIDVKNEHVIKGIHLEGLRKVGNPNVLAKHYYDEGIDEIVFMDAVAAYYDRNSLSEIIQKACEEVLIPITVGGGIRNIEDIQAALNVGADKVAINTKTISSPLFMKEQQMGTDGALRLLKSKPTEPFFVMNGDLLTNINFEHLDSYNIANKFMGTMCVREYDFQVPYGGVNIEDSKILSIEEKPIHKFFVSAGIYAES